VTPAAVEWEQAANVLCVRLDTIGDVLMTTPAIRALKESRAGRRITLLTSRAGAAAGVLVPEIDSVIVYDAPWLKATPTRPDSRHEHAMTELLRDGGFQAAVIFTTFSQSALPSALLCYLADIPLRLAHARENAYQLLTTRVAEREPENGIRHEVERQLDLVARVGCSTADRRLSLRVPPDDRMRVRALLASLEIDSASPWLVVHPGASAPSRRYPPEMFVEALALVVERTGATVVVTGDASEHELAAMVCARIPEHSHELAGVLTLGELSALIADAPVLLTNNTGPAHIAAAVGTPVVDLYALTNPQHTPWMVRSHVLSHDVPCRNCFRSVCPELHHECLRGVRPEQVADAVIDLLTDTDVPWSPVSSARLTSLSP
jgi:lipopolysaccharide heptosyltransferase II